VKQINDKAQKIVKALNSEAFDFEQVTVDNTAGGVALTAETYEGATRAFITIEGTDGIQIRYRMDGGAPTTTVGHLAYVGDVLMLESVSDIANFRAIRTADTSVTLSVTYSN